MPEQAVDFKDNLGFSTASTFELRGTPTMRPEQRP